jgi:hypothetical protein
LSRPRTLAGLSGPDLPPRWTRTISRERELIANIEAGREYLE